MRLHFCALAAVLHFSNPAGAPAQDAPPKKLTVLIKSARPFVFEKNGVPAGYSIELWKRVAEETKLPFEFKTAATVPEVIEALRAGKADVGFGALSITAEREAMLDFSYPYYKSGLQILASGATRSPFRAFLNLDVLKILGLLVIAIAINAHVLWWLERRKNPDCFPEGYVAGIWNSAWWSISTLITLGCENIAPTRGGRIVAVVWMLAGVALYSYVTATLTTTMTVNTLQSDVKSLTDLEGADVGTISGSAAEAALHEAKVHLKGFADLDSAARALAAGEVKAVIYDAPLLKYFLSVNSSLKLQLAGELFEKQDYGFALPAGSPYRKEINRALLKLAEEGFLDELDKKWFAPAS